MEKEHKKELGCRIMYMCNTHSCIPLQQLHRSLVLKGHVKSNVDYWGEPEASPTLLSSMHSMVYIIIIYLSVRPPTKCACVKCFT